MIDVSIIIVNYNTKMLLKQCLEFVLEKTHDLEYELIIVDNASTDDSLQMLRDEFPNVILIASSENLGFGRANNEGIKIAKGRNILFLNPDTKLINNAIKILSDFIDTSDKIGACGGNLYDEMMQPTHSFQRLFPSIMYELNSLLLNIPLKIFYGKNTDFNTKDSPLCVAYITGADLMVKSEIIKKIGGFNPSFFMYYEETELCYRIKNAKYKIISIPDAMIQHLEGKSFGQEKISPKRIKMILDSRYIFYKNCYSKLYGKIVDIIFNLNVYSRLFIFYLLRNRYSIKYKYWSTMLYTVSSKYKDL